MIRIPLGQGGALVEAIFVARPNRFVVEALLDDRLVRAHLADRGRLTEALQPGRRLLLAHRPASGRATAFQAVAAIVPGLDDATERLIGLDTILPNRLIGAALRARALPPFAEYDRVRAEFTVGRSRFDFQLSGADGACLLEVKSAGHLVGARALFPDAPTARGARHLGELAAVARQGARAAVVFVAQGDVAAIAMNTAVDPGFAAALHSAAADGVEIFGYACPLTRAGLALGAAVAVERTD